MRTFKGRVVDGRIKRRYPKAHAAGFLSACRWVEDGEHGPDQIVIGIDGESEAIGACLEWAGPVSGKGYGRVWANGRLVDAHRHAWTLDNEHEPVPDGMHVLHRCDNRRCVLGDHLFLGTRSDNMQDMSRKGRRSWAGEANPNARLTDEQVEAIRARYRKGNGAALAKEFGISLWTVMDIISGRRRRPR